MVFTDRSEKILNEIEISGSNIILKFPDGEIVTLLDSPEIAINEAKKFKIEKLKVRK